MILKWPDYWHNQFLGLRGHQLVYTPEEAGERIKPETRSTTFGELRSWQIDGETVETVADFILGGSKITADGDFGHEIKTLTP